MHKHLIFSTILFFVIYQSVFAQKTLSDQSDQYVVILSLDGFRADYIEKYDCKNLKKIAQKGVRALQMRPSNPTKTFPNHYTLVTGLYPEHHGLVLNSFFAPDLQLSYAIRDRSSVENGDFYGGEPIWATAQKQGLRTASYFWVGSETKIKGYQPNIWKKYKNVPFESKIDTVVHWLASQKRPRLVTMYHHEPDKSGHRYGPNAKKTAKMVVKMDSLVGVLYQKLMQLPIADKINFIIVSDHGMREISDKRVVYLDQYLQKKWIKHLKGGNPAYTIHAKEGQADKIYDALKKAPHLHVFKNGEVPSKYHFGNNPRFGDVIVIGEKGWSVFSKKLKKRATGKIGGTHGYLNTDDEMSAIFVGVGPGLRKGVSQKEINNVDVYNLLASLLSLSPAPNDGKIAHIKKFLKK